MTDLSNGKPKCLLPVGNFPIIYYPLSLLKKIGFTEVIVITQESAKNEVNNLTRKYELGLTLDVVALPHQQAGIYILLLSPHQVVGIVFDFY